MATEQIGLLLPIALISIGFGFSNPSFQSLISQIASHNSRGSALGIAQSANSLGRIAGPAWGGFSFASIGADWPFISGAAGLMPVFIVTLMLASHLKSRK